MDNSHLVGQLRLLHSSFLGLPSYLLPRRIPDWFSAGSVGFTFHLKPGDDVHLAPDGSRAEEHHRKSGEASGWMDPSKDSEEAWTR